MARFRVKFAQVENGWVQTFFRADEEEHELWFSHIVFENAFARLCETLSALVDENRFGSTIIWMDYPEEHEMRFSKEDENIKFEMWRFDGHERAIESKPVLEFSISGSCDEICLPFWRALRGLQALYDESEFKNRWRYEFPTRELDLLTNALGKSK